jgi:hypothetical protein
MIVESLGKDCTSDSRQLQVANPSQIAASACVASARRPREIRRFFMEHMSGYYAEKWKKTRMSIYHWFK